METAQSRPYLGLGAGDGPQGSEEDWQQGHEHQASICQRGALWGGHELYRCVQRLGSVRVRGIQSVKDNGGLRGRGRGLLCLCHDASEKRWTGKRANTTGGNREREIMVVAEAAVWFSFRSTEQPESS